MLNPDWVEWLMGFPVGWTDLDCDDPVPLGWAVDPAEGLWPTPAAADGSRASLTYMRGNLTLRGAAVSDGSPSVVSRTTTGCPKRKERLTACGNALVPQVMHFVAKRALQAVQA